MPKVAVTKRVHFNAAHRLHSSHLSDEENSKTFGPCNNPNYHGHNYELDVCVLGEIDPKTGYVADLRLLKQIITARVVDYLDHKNLNLDIPEFEEANPTAENLVVVIWKLLEGHLPQKLQKLVLWETPRSYVEYSGE